MTITSTTAKSYFETGDKPTEAQFGEAIDMVTERIAHVSTVAQLSALSTAKAADTPIVYVAGRTSAQDTGQGMFYLDPTSTVSADGGTVFKVGSGRALRQRDGITTNVMWHGAIGDGVADDSAAFQSAIDSGADIVIIPIPTSKYLVEDIVLRSNLSLICPGGYWRSGAELFCNTAGTSGSPKSIFKMTVERTNLFISGLIFNTDKEWVFGIYNEDTANFVSNSRIQNCNFYASLTRGVSAFLILTDFERCVFGFNGTAPAATHQAVRSEPATGGQAKQTNVVRFLGCNIYNADATDGAVYAEWGSDWVFRDTTFESLSTLAVTFAGILDVRFEGCWFETITSTEMIEATLDSSAAQGTRPVIVQNCFINAEDTTDRFATLGSSSALTMFDNVWIRAPASFVVSVQFGTDNAGLTDHRGNVVASGTDPLPSLRTLSNISLRGTIEQPKTGRDITPISRTTFATAEWTEIDTAETVSAAATEMKRAGNALSFRLDGTGSGIYAALPIRMVQFLRDQEITWSGFGYGDGSGNSTGFRAAIWDSVATPAFDNQSAAGDTTTIDSGASAAQTTSVTYTVSSAATTLRVGFIAGGISGTPEVKLETVELILGAYSSAPTSPSFQ